MTNEQKEAIDRLDKDKDCPLACGDITIVNVADIDTVLSLIKEQQEEIELIKEYAHQEIAHYTETIKDYRDDDKEENEHYIEELKEEREHWRDIEKIIQNKPKEELYMNWWKYGLYE